MEMTGAVIILLGSLIFGLSALGIIRMPDVYNRMQVGTKATTLGTIFVMVGMSFLHPEWTPKMVILLVFIVLTNPVSSHVVARGAHHSGEKMTDKTIDDKLSVKKEEK